MFIYINTFLLCVYIYTYIHIHTYIHIYIHTHRYKYIYRERVRGSGFGVRGSMQRCERVSSITLPNLNWPSRFEGWG